LEGDVVGRAARGGVLLTVAGLSTAVAGALFWFLLARLTGLGSVGAASSIVSAAMMPATVLGAGFGMAAARHVAARGPGAACGLLVFSLLLAGLAAVFSAGLAFFLDVGGGEEVAAGVLGFLMTAGGVGLQVLLGMEMFGAILAANLAGNVAKLVVGVAAALAGLGGLAVVLGFAAFPAVSLAVSSIVVAARGGVRGCGGFLGEARGLLGLGVSNTLYASSAQLPVSLGIYLYAVLGGEPIDTGALYLAMMAAQVVAMPASSLAAATLPSSVQEGRAMAPATLRLGLAAAMPLAAALAASPQFFYSLLGRGLLGRDSAAVLQLLVYTAPLLASLGTMLVEFNRRAAARPIALVSAIRLVLTAALLPPLAAVGGALGAAAAFAAATVAALVAASLSVPSVLLDVLRAEAALLPPSMLLHGSMLAAVVSSMLLAHALLYPYTRMLALVYRAFARKPQSVKPEAALLRRRGAQ